MNNECLNRKPCGWIKPRRADFVTGTDSSTEVLEDYGIITAAQYRGGSFKHSLLLCKKYTSSDGDGCEDVNRKRYHVALVFGSSVLTYVRLLSTYSGNRGVVMRFVISKRGIVEQAKKQPAQQTKREENVYNIYKNDNISQISFVPTKLFF